MARQNVETELPIHRPQTVWDPSCSNGNETRFLSNMEKENDSSELSYDLHMPSMVCVYVCVCVGSESYMRSKN